MATTRTFQDMLNQYLPNNLLAEEIVKRDWILKTAERDDGWLGGDLIVPFKGAQASSVAFGALTSETDIAEDTYVRGSITSQPEVWGSLKFNHRDLMEHGKVSEQNFLKILPDAIEDFLDYMKQCVSLSFLNGTFFARGTADGDASGNLVVDRVERFTLGQKVSIDDDNSSPVVGYVRTINIDTNTVTFYDARTAGSAVNLSTYTLDQNVKVYFTGSQTAGFTSLKLSLLSLANGGTTNLYGQAKTAYPYLQAINIDGSGLTSANILETIFNGYTTTRVKGKGDPSKCVMSYRNLGYVMTLLEQQKGAYHIDQKGTKVDAFGWTEITVMGVKGKLDIVAIQEMDDDYIMLLDMRAIKIYTNGFFKKRANPDGREYFEIRATTGYSYIVDMSLFGDLVLLRPSYCGIIYNIPL